ncbi:UNVERIFIED_CONTAM: hypothetical protein FKN15_004068 [Acipenser sinensis]
MEQLMNRKWITEKTLENFFNNEIGYGELPMHSCWHWHYSAHFDSWLPHTRPVTYEREMNIPPTDPGAEEYPALHFEALKSGVKMAKLQKKKKKKKNRETAIYSVTARDVKHVKEIIQDHLWYNQTVTELALKTGFICSHCSPKKENEG